MKITLLLAASVLGLASTAASSTVWVPDVDSTGVYQDITFASFGVDAGTYDLVFFDAGTIAAIEPSTTSLTLTTLNGLVEIAPATAPYTAAFGTDTATLGATP